MTGSHCVVCSGRSTVQIPSTQKAGKLRLRNDSIDIFIPCHGHMRQRFLSSYSAMLSGPPRCMHTAEATKEGESPNLKQKKREDPCKIVFPSLSLNENNMAMLQFLLFGQQVSLHRKFLGLASPRHLRNQFLEEVWPTLFCQKGNYA